MLLLVATLLLAALTVLAVSLQKTYSRVPRRELKRRAAAGDELAQGLYQVAAYGMSLRIVLWAITGLCAAGFFILADHVAPSWLALLGSLALLWFAFAWLPNSRVTKVGNRLAKIFAPPLTWLLNHTYPLLSRLDDWLRLHSRITFHTGLYQKEDLLELLEEQKHQPDNRMSETELRVAEGALQYGDKLVSEVMTPRRAVKMVSLSEALGPVLMNELHDSGFSRIPVYEGKPDNVVGVLHVHELVNAKAGGKVSDIMSKRVFYVHDEQPLSHVLDAFLKTKHQLFMVVNNFEEIVGIITIEDILEQILGKPILDEFDKYEDMRAVAALAASSEHKERHGKPLK